MESEMRPQADDDGETIVAISTPPGVGGIGVVRVSGPSVVSIAFELLGEVPATRTAKFCRFRDERRQAIDEGIALFFEAPNSYTGEDVLELHGHGGPLVLDLLVERILRLGARPARPGEFTERAFLNGKLDLAQAEAVADLIASRTQAAAKAAMRSLSGVFSEELTALDSKLAELRVYVEADIDFSDEDIEGLAPATIKARLGSVRGDLNKLLDRARPGTLLATGAVVVLAGAPNAGKSSVMNAVAGTDRAIVSDRPGTTRDLVETDISLDGLSLRLIDTAGLRDSTDPLEGEGIRRATAAINEADLTLLVIDDTVDSKKSEESIKTKAPILRVVNKCDVTGRPYGSIPNRHNSIAFSATEKKGLEELLSAIKSVLAYEHTEAPVSARRRHLDALGRANNHLEAAGSEEATALLELCAEELRLAQDAIGEVTGRVTTEDLLGKIFSTFCVGK